MRKDEIIESILKIQNSVFRDIVPHALLKKLKQSK